MMSGVSLETCWAFNKLWNNKFYYKAASCWYFYWFIYDERIHKYQKNNKCLVVYPNFFPFLQFLLRSALCIIGKYLTNQPVTASLKRRVSWMKCGVKSAFAYQTTFKHSIEISWEVYMNTFLMPDAFEQWFSTDRRRSSDASIAVGYSK